MSDDEDALRRFGTPLDPLEEDEVPTKKPIAVEDQIVTDKNGRRRFHGAFTGGFSAGFWNTVGSLEGWKPQSFKSSRAEKAENKFRQQSAADFMDDEDLGEFGIAPQRVQATEDFAAKDSSRKRKFKQPETGGPIPGVPVLNQLLAPPKDKVAVRLLKRMGWKPGQGIGARQTRREKRQTGKRNERERYLMQKYGCEMGPNRSKATESTVDEGEEDDEDEVTFAPDDFEPFVCSVKDNTFGLGYSGLSREPILSKNRTSQQHLNLFGPLEVLGKNNQKLSIRGQAFGVGALEEDDDDIYARDDMTKYDFSLEKKKKEKSSKSKLAQDVMIIAGFDEATKNPKHQKKVFIIQISDSFAPRNWAVRRTRFEPLDEIRSETMKKSESYKARGLGRHDLNPEERGKILGEVSRKKQPPPPPTYLDQVNEKYKKKAAKSQSILDLISSRESSFTKGEVLKDGKEECVPLDETAKKENEKVLKDAEKITKVLPSTSSVFKPFLLDESKQDRYDKFVEAKLKTNDEILKFLGTVQPIHMSEWDREMEMKEFIQARNMFKPLIGIMSDRFVTEVAVLAERETEKPKYDANKKIVVQRTKAMWKPSSQLCKRFNIAEPFGGGMVEEKVKKKNKFSVFDYLEHSMNRKEDFVTPVIIPKHIEKPKPVVNQEAELEKSQISRMSAKDFFKEKDIEKIEEVKEVQVKEVPKPIVKTKPKTELELEIEKRKKQHPSEKKDLFKAIFDSSSEGEGDEEDTSKPSTSVSAEIVASLIKPAGEVNILRNSSPPRGIFAALFTPKPIPIESPAEPKPTEPLPLKISFQPKEKRLQQPDLNLYGPQLPQIATPIPVPTEDMDSKIVNLLKKSKDKAKIVEEWVEKSDKKKKKSKKSKDKHKKKRRSSSSDSNSDSSSDSSDGGRKKTSRKHKKDKKKKKKKRK